MFKEITVRRPHVDTDYLYLGRLYMDEGKDAVVALSTTDLVCPETGVVVYSTPSVGNSRERANRWLVRHGFSRLAWNHTRYESVRK